MWEEADVSTVGNGDVVEAGPPEGVCVGGAEGGKTDSWVRDRRRLA
jgi:hypothetical protein